MYKVVKVLNNNTVLASNNREEVIMMNKGLGFGKKAGESFEPEKNTKVFLMQKSYQPSKGTNFLQYIGPVYLEIAGEIVRLIEAEFGKCENNIRLQLADYIYFALEQSETNRSIENPYYNEIECLFSKEYAIAKAANLIIYKFLHKRLRTDELSFVALYIHSAISCNNVQESIQAMQIINDSLKKIQEGLGIEVSPTSIPYQRLMNHVKYLMFRISANDMRSLDISDLVKGQFPYAYTIATQICEDLSIALGVKVPGTEPAYLALHIERIFDTNPSSI